MIYHYTDVDRLTLIVRAGVLKCSPTPLFRDTFARGPSMQTPPCVWFTENPISEATSFLSMCANTGYRGDGVGRVARIVCDDAIAEYDYAGFVHHSGIDPEWWKMNFSTAAMCGGTPEHWRICTRDVPAKDWLAVEVMSGATRETTAWAAYVAAKKGAS